MFGLQSNSLPRCATYLKAERLYHAAHAPRNAPRSRPRPLTGKDMRSQKQVFMLGQDVVFRYHGTDVVRYHPDGAVEINVTYTSKSTATFASCLSPLSFYVMGDDEQILCDIRGQAYAVPRNSNYDRIVRIDPAGNVSNLQPFLQGKVSRKRLNAAMRPYQDALVHMQSLVGVLDRDSIFEFLQTEANQKLLNDYIHVTLSVGDAIITASQHAQPHAVEDPTSGFWVRALDIAARHSHPYHDPDEWRAYMYKWLRSNLVEDLIERGESNGASLLDYTPQGNPKNTMRLKLGECVVVNYNDNN